MKHPKFEQTLVIVKPDGIQRGLIGEVISRFERVGLKLVGIKMMHPSPEHTEAHYILDPGWRMSNGTKVIKGYIDKGLTPPSNDPMEVSGMVLEKLKKYLSASPVIPMIWQGAHAATIVRKIVGGTEPLTSAPGTIRGDYVLDSYKMADDDNRAIRNIVHASGSASEAEMEIKHWFNEDEIYAYSLLLESVHYDETIDGIMESSK